MKNDSMLFEWYIEEFKNQPERVRGVERLLKEGHTGLAESAVVKSLRGKLSRVGQIRVNAGESSYLV